VQISSKIFPQITNFANFVKNRYFRQYDQFFVKNEILWSLLMRVDNVISGWTVAEFL